LSEHDRRIGDRGDALRSSGASIEHLHSSLSPCGRGSG
jgi:hypothetical protein